MTDKIMGDKEIQELLAQLTEHMWDKDVLIADSITMVENHCLTAADTAEEKLMVTNALAEMRKLLVYYTQQGVKH